MKLLLICLVCISFAASDSENEAELLKRLLVLLEKSKAASSVNKRYFYQNGLQHSPSVDKKRPGDMRIDLQMDEAVMNKCPGCKLFVYYKCISDECHNKNEQYFPAKGYSWAEFRRLFVIQAVQGGVWITGLEDGMEYEVWDNVLFNGQPYSGYTNTERRTIKIPK